MQLKKESDHEIIQVGDDRELPVEQQVTTMMMMKKMKEEKEKEKESQYCSSPYEKVRILASGNAVVVFSLSECCMCHVVKRLLFGLGVGPTIIELDEEKYGREIQDVLYQLIIRNGSDGGPGPIQQQHQQQQKMAVPAVFIGGKYLGGVQTVMSCHINGTLVPLLKNVGALWL